MITASLSSRDENSKPSRQAYRGRFAPSPTGDLHMGSLVAALGSWLVARQHNGKWLVRIEDIDRLREVPGAADRQLEMLKRFGMVSDLPVLRQSQRYDLYQTALQQLIDRDQAFACFCSRNDLSAQGGIHHFCVSAKSGHGQSPSWRLRVPDTMIDFTDRCAGTYVQNLHQHVGDFVLRRADGLWAYQLAVIVDDAQQGITDVVRGADLIDSTPRQIYLQRLLNLPTPDYAHLPLVLDSSGVKLSKSQAAQAIDPDNPIPTLDAAWQALQQTIKITDHNGNIDRWLYKAIDYFSLPKHDLIGLTYSGEKPANFFIAE